MPDRDKAAVPVAVTRKSAGRRSGAGVRRQRFPEGMFLTEHGANLSPAEIAFGRAIDRYKRKYGRPFPTWCEVLKVVQAMGYRLVAEPVEV